MAIKKGNINQILTALDRQIGVLGGDSIGLVVCGGSALAALGYFTRMTTKDVDILGIAEIQNENLIVKHLSELPEWLKESAEKVARDFNLPDYWLNTGPADQVKSGLPAGFEKRLHRTNYGNYLTVYYIDRFDQIHFKLYASLDRGGYHVEDLFTLEPTESEIEQAARWTITQDVSEGFKEILKDFLQKHGYETIAARI